MRSSERQLAILEEWKTTGNNIVISAVAGSGKTSTLMLLLSEIKEKTLFVAFNKTIQTEIQSRIEAQNLTHAKAITLHSLGLTAIRELFSKTPKSRVIINNNKSWDIIKKMQEEFKKSRLTRNKLSAKLSYDIVNMNEVSRMFLTDDFDTIDKHLLSMDTFIDRSENLKDLWKIFVEKREQTYLNPNLEVDFTDMIYIPVKFGLEIPEKPTYLMVDECQDLNLAQHKLIDLMLTPSLKKWIAVGDRNQAIYGFAGANSNSFEMFFEKPGEIIELPLDICYRCATSIIDEANEVYDVMLPYKEEEGIVDEVFDSIDIKDNSLVICRNTGPLVKLYFELISEGRSAYINGNEILNHLIKFLKPFKSMSVKLAKIEMDYMLEVMSEGDDKERYKKFIFEENAQNFRVISNALFSENDIIEDVIKKLESIFETKENAIQLCTIHKSKGLEADVVYILNEKLIPSKFAKSPEQLKQEQNLKYVARTRAKHELYYLNI